MDTRHFFKYRSMTTCSTHLPRSSLQWKRLSVSVISWNKIQRQNQWFRVWIPWSSPPFSQLSPKSMVIMLTLILCCRHRIHFSSMDSQIQRCLACILIRTVTGSCRLIFPWLSWSKLQANNGKKHAVSILLPSSDLRLSLTKWKSLRRSFRLRLRISRSPT